MFSYSYNASVVSGALIFQGIVSGILGGLLLFRRKALLSDVLSHATLPGVALGFLFSAFLLGGAGKEWAILIGALVMISLCLLTVSLFSRWMSQDAALASALSGFYGLGVLLLSYVQVIPSGAKAGLEYFLLGQSATINSRELQLMLVGCAVSLGIYLLLRHSIKTLCFDENYAKAKGYPTGMLDFLITFLAAVTIAIGIKATGLILVIGLMTIPALASSLLFNSWNKFLVGAATIGGLSCHIGTSFSAAVDGLPTGSAIIMSGTVFYLAALIYKQGQGGWHRRERKPQPAARKNTNQPAND